MTTAHRPTFHAAIGGKEQGGGRYVAGVSRVHVHDLAGQLTVKRREHGQGTQAELRGKDLRAELEEREAEHLKAIGKASGAPALKPPPPPPDLGDEDDDALIIDPDDADDKHAPAPLTAATASDSDEDDDDDEDETEELMRELERIKKERAAEAAKREKDNAETEERERDSSILQGNPLLDPTRLGAAQGSSSSFSVKRRWDDDVVFKNQAREPKKEARRFINDTVRNDFHRKFLYRYIK
uniref:Cwf15/Cwc15 cell cycle control protein n=1 Tax=Emiliania huxleyi TaxID=2903 RepID=A0A7S3TLX6_EMIHU|mmetsp:Transcript_9680/g.28854  ORF Transcript_9680/g.28854 Transcript_9680/m.28854 type:complete len:240 (+) Transcript_9680:40-759(+)